jgi:D-alanine-D-alanine ligase
MAPKKVSVLFYEPAPGSRDEVVGQVNGALSEEGHEVSLMPVNDDLSKLISSLETQKPDIVFNLCETFAGKDAFEMHVTAVLELLGQRFTGTGPVGMALRQDKALSKKLLQFYGIPCPAYAVFDKENLEFAGRMRFPLFVKPLRGDGSLCVDDYSLVSDYESLITRAGQIQDELGQPALVEEYIEGRELYASLLGNNPPEVLPLVEMDFSALPAKHPRIYGRQGKFGSGTEQYEGTKSTAEVHLPPEVLARTVKIARDAVRALQAQDYARVDIRLSPDGTPYVIEVNANPYLEETTETALAALKAGIEYPALINRILELAWERCEKAARVNPHRTRGGVRLRSGKTVPSCISNPG